MRPVLPVFSVIALTAGLLLAASFDPLTHWAAALAALTALLVVLRSSARRGATPTRQALLTWLFGMAWFSAGLAWLYISMHDIGGMPAPMAALAVLLFAAYLSLYPAAAAWLAARLCPDPVVPLGWVAAIAGAWTLAEILKGWVFTGFPWLSVGYSQIDGPMAGLAPLVGVYGLGGVTMAVAALLAIAIVPGQSRAATGIAPRSRALGERLLPLALAAALTLAPLALSPELWTRPSGPPLSVRLLQGNVPQDLKFQPQRTLSAMEDYIAGFEAGGASLTVMPETAWTVPWNQTPEPLSRRLLDHVARGHAVAIGMPLVRAAGSGGEWRPTNSVMLLSSTSGPSADAAAPIYDKRHLVPFGEFVPWGFGWFVRMMNIPLGDFGRGRADQAPFPVGGQRVAFNICYEDLFGEEIRTSLAGEQGATILANVSNIGWFGKSHALPQHLQISRTRSLETGRPMIRATNTGMTAAIDAQGRVQAQLPSHVAGALDVTVQGTTGLTPFARFGNLPALLTALILLALAARGRRQLTTHRPG